VSLECALERAGDVADALLWRLARVPADVAGTERARGDLAIRSRSTESELRDIVRQRSCQRLTRRLLQRSRGSPVQWSGRTQHCTARVQNIRFVFEYCCRSQPWGGVRISASRRATWRGCR